MRPAPEASAGLARQLPWIDEAKARLEHVDEHGPTPLAFTFTTTFPATETIVGITLRRV
jgi:hypothetical protein